MQKPVFTSFTPRHWIIPLLTTLSLLFTLQTNALEVKVTVENLGPENGHFLTPPWIGFHGGSFDIFDAGSSASAALESISEDGSSAALASSFLSAGDGTIQGTLTAIGPVAPGKSVSMNFLLNADSAFNRYVSYTTMVIPSNDAFLANADPMAYALWDDEGNFTPVSFEVPGSTVWDAGTEVNDESPTNTAFFGQAAPNTGDDQGGVVAAHAGFMAAGSGGILDDAMFAAADFTAAGYNMLRITVTQVEPTPMEVVVTVENLGPENGHFLTPPWIGFHGGSFDVFDAGSSASAALESISEDGSSAALASSFLSAGDGTIQGTLTAIGPVAPGQSVSMNFLLNAGSAFNRYVSYTTMVIPSNDAFLANGDPMAYPLWDDEGNFTPVSFEVSGSAVWDAGTEVNDESSTNTAFFGQAAPNTGDDQGGVVATHPGFMAAGNGGILDDAMFAAADFTVEGYNMVRITVTEVEPVPVEVVVTVENLGPENGHFLTPPWIGFHGGSFDVFDAGSSASAALESISEDGSSAALASSFLSAGDGTIQGTLTAIGPVAPGQSVSMNFLLNAGSAFNRYVSYTTMVIPSNDAFLANADPMAYPLWDDEGNFTPVSFEVPGSAVWDAGTEVNDESSTNTAFFGQAAPNTGDDQGGVVAAHPGFMAAGNGGILDDAMFAAADFTVEGYNMVRITVELATTKIVTRGDFNGDGNTDILLQHQDGFIGTWFMNGAEFTSADFFSPNNLGDSSWKIVGTADFNQDGNPDLLLQHDMGLIGIWMMEGTKLIEGSLTEPEAPSDPNARIVGTGDFNGDGNIDLVFEGTDGQLTVWYMSGISRMETVDLLPNSLGDADWSIKGIADFNGDDHPDLLIQHVAGFVGVWLMDGIELLSAEFLSPNNVGDPGWTVAGTGDYDGDGKPDILLQFEDGLLGVWFMDGLTRTEARLIQPEPGLEWRVVGP